AHGGGPGRDRPVHRLLRGAAVRADPVAYAEVGNVAHVRRAQHPELGLHRAGVIVGAGGATLVRLDDPAGVPGAGGGQRAGGDLDLHDRARIPDAVPELVAGALAVPAAHPRHRPRPGRRPGAGGVQPRQLHGRADPVGKHPAAGALRHVLQDLQYPGDALDLPHRQGDPDRGGAGAPGADGARVRRNGCGAGRWRECRHLPGGAVDGGWGDRRVQVGHRTRARARRRSRAPGAGGADGTARDVEQHVEPARRTPAPDARAAPVPRARGGGGGRAGGRRASDRGTPGSGSASAAGGSRIVRRANLAGAATAATGSDGAHRGHRRSHGNCLAARQPPQPAITNSASTASHTSRMRQARLMASRSSGSAGMPEANAAAPGTPDSVSSPASSASSVRTQARAAAPRKPGSSENEAPSFSRHAVNTASKLPTSAIANVISCATGQSRMASSARAPSAVPAGNRWLASPSAAIAARRYSSAPNGPSRRNQNSTPNQRRRALSNTAPISAP